MINDIYTSKKVVDEMGGFFTENGFIQLNEFLSSGFKEFRENMEKETLLEIYEPLFCLSLIHI